MRRLIANGLTGIGCIILSSGAFAQTSNNTAKASLIIDAMVEFVYLVEQRCLIKIPELEGYIVPVREKWFEKNAHLITTNRNLKSLVYERVIPEISNREEADNRRIETEETAKEYAQDTYKTILQSGPESETYNCRTVVGGLVTGKPDVGQVLEAQGISSSAFIKYVEDAISKTDYVLDSSE